jgi:hypothetical protein
MRKRACQWLACARNGWDAVARMRMVRVVASALAGCHREDWL